jgi:hypothetical protein
MLIAAMILGLIAGVGYFLGGISGIVHVGQPWWMIILIPIGVLGTLGGILVLMKSNYAAFLLLLASLLAAVSGVISLDEAISADFIPPRMPMHPFGGTLYFLSVPMFALIIATALAFFGRQRTNLHVDASET